VSFAFIQTKAFPIIFADKIEFVKTFSGSKALAAS
jgi:hypothetical protein